MDQLFSGGIPPGQIAASHDLIVEEAVNEHQLIVFVTEFLDSVAGIHHSHVGVQEKKPTEFWVRSHPIGHMAVPAKHELKMSKIN
jgi:hypothetical protein